MEDKKEEAKVEDKKAKGEKPATPPTRSPEEKMRDAVKSEGGNDVAEYVLTKSRFITPFGEAKPVLINASLANPVNVMLPKKVQKVVKVPVVEGSDKGPYKVVGTEWIDRPEGNGLYLSSNAPEIKTVIVNAGPGAARLNIARPVK